MEQKMVKEIKKEDKFMWAQVDTIIIPINNIIITITTIVTITTTTIIMKIIITKVKLYLFKNGELHYVFFFEEIF